MYIVEFLQMNNNSMNKTIKIYTITCHAVDNYGPVLQAYALQQYLMSIGIDTKIIDYQPDYNKNPIGYTGIIKIVRDFITMPDKYIVHKTFNKFREKNLLTTNVYKTEEQLKNTNLQLNACIVGSDQVWNHNLVTGKDPVFYLSFTNVPKFSYAASLPLPTLTEQHKLIIDKFLKAFKLISVREQSAQFLLNDMGIKASCVPDPVFLLSRSEWDRRISTPRLIKEKYILVYCFNRQHNVASYAEKLGKEKNLKVVYVTAKVLDLFVSFKGIHKYGVSPFEFVSLIKHSEHVVTNSFHGMAFSIIYNRPIHVFMKEINSNARMTNLLEIYNIGERLVKNKLIQSDIDFCKVNTKISEQRLVGVNFVNEIINSIS